MHDLPDNPVQLINYAKREALFQSAALLSSISPPFFVVKHVNDDILSVAL